MPPFRWIGKSLYGWVARNRYALSKCRGGACRSVKVEELERQAPQDALRLCHWFGMLMRLPLTLGAILRQVFRNCLRFARTYHRRFDFLDGRLQLFMLNGLPCDLISLLFGEHFLMIVYDGIAIDPGPSRLRGALLRHLSVDLQTASIQYSPPITTKNMPAISTGWQNGRKPRSTSARERQRAWQSPRACPGSTSS